MLLPPKLKAIRTEHKIPPKLEAPAAPQKLLTLALPWPLWEVAWPNLHDTEDNHDSREANLWGKVDGNSDDIAQF